MAPSWSRTGPGAPPPGALAGAALERAYDAMLARLPEVRQDALTDALARCADDAARRALMREQMGRRAQDRRSLSDPRCPPAAVDLSEVMPPHAELDGGAGAPSAPAGAAEHGGDGSSYSEADSELSAARTWEGGEQASCEPMEVKTLTYLLT